MFIENYSFFIVHCRLIVSIFQSHFYHIIIVWMEIFGFYRFINLIFHLRRLFFSWISCNFLFHQQMPDIKNGSFSCRYYFFLWYWLLPFIILCDFLCEIFTFQNCKYLSRRCALKDFVNFLNLFGLLYSQWNIVDFP